MYSQDYGDPSNPHVWLLHGSGAPAYSLESFALALSARFRVHLPHFPGYGHTPHDPEKAVQSAITRLASRVRAHDKPVVLVGHSFGAYRMIRLFGELGPEYVRGMYGLGAIASLPEGMREAYEQAESWARAGEGIVEGLAGRWFSPAHIQADPATHGFVERCWSDCDIDAVARELYEPIDGGVADGIVAASRVPMALRVGTADVSAPPELSRALVGLRPGVALELVEGAGHFVHLEDMQGALEGLVGFVGRCDLTPHVS